MNDTFPNAFEIPRGSPYYGSPLTPDSPPPPPTIAPPLGELGEEYYCKRDEFTRYIEESVNPERIRAGLPPIDIVTAGVCYRILNDFAIQNAQRTTL